MRENLRLLWLRIAIVSIAISISSGVCAQWTRKADALKPRSELGETVIYNSKLYSFTGFSDSLRHAEPTGEVYNPATNTWSYLASMPPNTAMTHQDIVQVDNTIWHIGGRVGQNPGPMSSVIWIYNITANTWSKGPEIRNPATGQPMVIAASGSVLLGRVLHIFGGFTPTACNNDQDKYHLTLNVDTWLSNPSLPAQWENKLQPLPVKRNHISAIAFAGKIYAIGGQLGHDCGGGKEVSTCHVYNPVTDAWTQLPSLPTGRSHAEGSIFAIDGKIYLVGGQGSDGNSTKKVTIFDPAANNGIGSWTESTSLALPYIYEGLSAAVIGTTFIISHGSRGSSRYPQKTTYSRTITRNPVYKLGFPSDCLNLSDSSGALVKGYTLLYTIDSTKSYSTSSNASWLTVSKNATGTTNQNAVDIEVTANTSNLKSGTYSATITATGTGNGPNYTPATLCVNLTVQPKAIPSSYSLFTSASGAGSISKSPDLAAYNSGTNVTISAYPDEGNQFAGWSGDAAGLVNPLTISMNGDKHVTATFKPIPAKYNLNVSANGSGSVTKSPDQTSYDSGTNVTLTAVPDAGQQFTGWSGNISEMTNPVTIVVDANKAIAATFEPIAQPVSLNVIINGNGSVTKNPDQTKYEIGSRVTLTAIPATGQQFTGWSGAIGGTQNPLTITMDGDKSIEASFVQIPALVTNITTTTGKTYSLSQLFVGNTVYTDRVYQATSVPAFLNNAPLIKTANDDKYNKSTSALSFSITQNATVYVAYDPRATTLPAWLSGWQKVGQQIGVNDSKISYLVLYSKDYPVGKVTLGGNFASPAAGAANNYFVVVLARPAQRLLNNPITSDDSGNIQIYNSPNSKHEKLPNKIAGFKIFPNPNNGDKIFIDANNFQKFETVTITIYNAIGKIFASKKVTTGSDGAFKDIIVSKSLSKGLYIIKVESASATMQQKLLID